MKVLFIRKQYKAQGGAERYLETLIERLVGQGVEAHLLCMEWAGRQPPDLQVHHVSCGRPFHFWENLAFASAAGRFVQRHDFDAVFSLERTPRQDIYRAGDGLHRVWLARKKEFSGPVGRLAASFNPLHAAMCVMERRTLDPRNTRFIIANSPMVRREMAEYFQFPEENVRLIPNGVDVDKFRPAEASRKANLRRKFGLPEGRTVFLLVGSGFFRKGVSFAARLIRRLKSSGALLWVVGRGRLPSGIDRSLVLHQRKATSVSEVYQAADLFLLPTLYDPFSNASLEALASGLPVITSSFNGLADFLRDGRDGWVWRDLRDVEGIARAVRPALDGDALAAMGVAARATAESLSLERNIDATLRLIREAANLRARRPV